MHRIYIMQGGGVINKGAWGAIIKPAKYTLICYEGIIIGAAGGAIIRKQEIAKGSGVRLDIKRTNSLAAMLKSV